MTAATSKRRSRAHNPLQKMTGTSRKVGSSAKPKMATNFTYSNSPVKGGGMEERTIGAGVVNNLLTESDYVSAEKDNVKRLELIVRNLRPLKRVVDGPRRDGLSGHDGVGGIREYDKDSFKLSYAELEYLGF